MNFSYLQHELYNGVLDCRLWPFDGIFRLVRQAKRIHVMRHKLSNSVEIQMAIQFLCMTESSVVRLLGAFFCKWESRFSPSEGVVRPLVFYSFLEFPGFRVRLCQCRSESLCKGWDGSLILIFAPNWKFSLLQAAALRFMKSCLAFWARSFLASPYSSSCSESFGKLSRLRRCDVVSSFSSSAFYKSWDFLFV